MKPREKRILHLRKALRLQGLNLTTFAIAHGFPVQSVEYVVRHFIGPKKIPTSPAFSIIHDRFMDVLAKVEKDKDALSV